MTTDPRDAEIARLQKLWDDHDAAWSERVAGLTAALHKAEAERDAALAQVAGAYEAVAKLPAAPEWHWRFEPHWSASDLAAAIRALTPTDALAALSRRDAQMRAEGRKEGLWEAAEAVPNYLGPDGWANDAILAAAEKEAPHD